MKKLFTLATLACACGLTITSAFAGPLMLGPSALPMPKIMSIPIVRTSPASVQLKVLNTYRQLRSFWVSRAIVR